MNWSALSKVIMKSMLYRYDWLDWWSAVEKWKTYQISKKWRNMRVHFEDYLQTAISLIFFKELGDGDTFYF